ncbi:MAG: aliphatic sulfonate ABC transporter substrate-binding protein [Burkholderiaceae bacterium]
MIDRTRRRLALAATVTAAAAPLGFAPAARAQSTPREVRLGFQKGAAILVLARKRQVIEKRLQKIGIDSVKWVEFQFGPPMLEALGAGAIDLGSVGDTPPIFAQAGQSRLVYAAATPSAQHAVLVPRQSPIRGIEQLKGKRVAVGKGSSAHALLIRVLALSGLSLKDIEPAYLAPADATAAFNGGNVDAWVVWDPYFAIAQQHYGARVLADTSDRRLVSSSFYMAGKDFAERHPAVLVAVLEELATLTRWSGEHRDDLAALAAEATGIDAKTWSTAFARAEFSLGPVTPAHVAGQQQLADDFQAIGVIPRKINVADIVWHGLDK